MFQAFTLSRQAQAVFFFLILMLACHSTIAHAQLQSASLDNPNTSPHVLLYVVQSDEKPPPFSTNKVIGQVVLGSVTGLVAGIAGGLIGVAIEDCHDEDWLCGLSGALLGVSAGVVVGSSVGVYMVGRTETVEIGYGRTLLGSAAGFITSALALSGVSGGDSEFAVIALLVGPALGAALLGNTSRRYRAGHGPSALLNWDEGQLHLGMPALHQQPLSGLPQTSVRSVRLLDVRW